PVNALGQPVVLLRYGAGDGSGRFGGTKFGAPVALPPPKFGEPKFGEGNTPREEADVVNDAWVYKEDKLPPPDNRFFNYVDAWDDKNKEMISDEVWAAQENLWVQRELYRRIKAANDAVAVATPVAKDKENKWPKFRNFYWDIELTPAPGGGV